MATLDEAIAAGLFHPNCGHSVTPYHPAMRPTRQKSKQEKKEDALLYERKQELNRINRQVRKWQDRRRAVQGVASKEQLRRIDAKVDYWRKTSREYAKKHNLKNYNLPKKGY